MQTVKIAYTENTTPCLFNPNSRSGIFNTIRKKDSDSHSGVSCPRRIEVPEIPLSYNWTGAMNKVTPIALITPAIKSIRKLKGENFSSSFSFFKHIPPD